LGIFNIIIESKDEIYYLAKYTGSDRYSLCYTVNKMAVTAATALACLLCDSHTSRVQNITLGVLLDSAGYWQASTMTRVNSNRTIAVNQDTARTVKRTTEGYFSANCWAIDETVSQCDQHCKLKVILSEEAVRE